MVLARTELCTGLPKQDSRLSLVSTEQKRMDCNSDNVNLYQYIFIIVWQKIHMKNS